MSSDGSRPRAILLILQFLMLGVGTFLVADQAYSASTLQSLIEGARAEGQLDLMVVTTQGEKGAKELADAFKQRFGLNIKINADLSGQEDLKFNQAVAETKSGIPSSFDLMQAQVLYIYNLVANGAAEQIENWDLLLKEIAPEAHKIKDKVSPGMVSGHGFQWGTRVLALLYNTRLISKEDLPKTWKEKTEPRYAGAYSVPPFSGTITAGILKYDKDEWLQIIRELGQNKRHVLVYAAAVQRMLLGELKFGEASTSDYFLDKARDPNSPIGLTFYEDFTPLDQMMNVVRKGARHPNAARLFALWAAGAEANRIFERNSFISNLFLGTGPTAQKLKEALAERNAKPVSWLDNPQTEEKFRWLQTTEEGRKYASAVGKAQREGK